MQVVHTQKFIKVSPKKLRPVARVAVRLSPQRAIDVLPHIGRRSADPLVKAIKTTIANAKDQGLEGDLIFKEIQITEGPRHKRGRAASRGRWHTYKKRTSHIRIILETKKTKSKKIDKKKKETKQAKKKGK